MRRSRNAAVGAGVLVLVLASLLTPLTARAATTYTVQVFQDFFDRGVPGFSARFYPGEITVHPGDTIHFNEGIALFPEDVYPQDLMPDEVWTTGGSESFLVPDPDEGARGVKLADEEFGTCGLQDNPCSWTGGGNDIVFGQAPPEGQEPPDFSMWVTIDASPGTTLWANSAAGSDATTNMAVHVVAQGQDASTQQALDARAAALMEKDYEDAAALHARMGSKRTSHVNSAGQKVFDVWVGAVGGPIELFASYPRRISVPTGSRIQYHFQDTVEPHTATFGGPVATDLFRNGFDAVCDPDGDSGTAADTPAGEGDPPCAPPAQLEIDVDERILYETGDGRVTGERDLETSGLKTPQFPEASSFDAYPWTVRMTKSSDKDGFRFICLVHGGFMGGRVVVGK